MIQTAKLILVIFGAVIFGCVFNSLSIAQETLKQKDESAKLDAASPSVYLAYEGTGTKKVLGHKGDQVLRLRLQNNSRFNINIDASRGEDKKNQATISRLPNGSLVPFADKDELVTEICFQIEDVAPSSSLSIDPPWSLAKESRAGKPAVRVPNGRKCNSRYDIERIYREGLWIRPGESVLFEINREALGTDTQLYTEFNYEWEFEKSEFRPNEPIHRVYFYSWDILE